MSIDQAFPETGADGRRALAASMARFLPAMEADADRERAPDAWAWRCMREVAQAMTREPGCDDRDPHQLEAAAVIAKTARVFLAAATKAGDENGVRCWTQILTYAGRLTP